MEVSAAQCRCVFYGVICIRFSLMIAHSQVSFYELAKKPSVSVYFTLLKRLVTDSLSLFLRISHHF